MADADEMDDMSRVVSTVCPYCGVGCNIDLHILDERIIRASSPYDSVVNHGNLCVKGRFGFDFVHHKDRLKTPLVKKNGRFEPVSWQEALEFVASRLVEIRRKHGPDSIAALSSAKCTNEENYLMQKFMRATIGTNNVENCARQCHSASVAGMQMAIGSSAMSNSIGEIRSHDCFIVTGSNTTETFPVIGLEMKAAVRRYGARLIVIDPREIELTKFASLWLRQRPGTDSALFNAMAHVIIKEGLYSRRFVEERTEGFEEFSRSVEACTPKWAESITGVEAERIAEAARIYAKAERAGIYWDLGITEHAHGTLNVVALANLALLTGHIGREGTGLNPIRGQNNVQGASDSGALPNAYPDYQPVSDEKIRRKFEDAWKAPLPATPGLTIREMVDAAGEGRVKAMYIMGFNLMMSEPNLNYTRRCLENLEFLVVQDIFLNETGGIADVILPASSFAEKDGTFTNTERRVQRVRKALEPLGDSRPDWLIICDLARKVEEKMGVATKRWAYPGPEQVWDEMASLCPSFSGISYERIKKVGLQWPCPDKTHGGTSFLHEGAFPRGRGRLHAVPYYESAELSDEEYPYTLSTGRLLYLWHGGTMSRRSSGLDEASPRAYAEISPEDAEKLGCKSGDMLMISSRRGQISVEAKVTSRSPPGTIFMPIHFAEAAANLLTIDALDPVSKIPEYKVCAVRVELAEG